MHVGIQCFGLVSYYRHGDILVIGYGTDKDVPGGSIWQVGSVSSLTHCVVDAMVPQESYQET